MQPSTQPNQLFLELLKEQSNYLNRECQEFQTQIKSLIHEITRDTSTTNKLNRICDNFSTSINKISVEYIIKFESNIASSSIKKAPNDKYTAKTRLPRHKGKKHAFSDNESIGSSHNNVPNVSSYCCDLCNKDCVNLTRLKEHKAQAHSTKKPYKCSECHKAFKLKRFLHAHIRDDHNGFPMECNECDDRFKYHSDLRNHIRQQHNGYNIECNDCDIVFNDKLELNRHRNTVHSIINQNPLKCDVCGKVYASQIGLNVHKLIHSDNTFKCSLCSETFMTKISLTKHIINLHNKDGWKCGGCAQTFPFKTDLKEHIKRVHGVDVNQENGRENVLIDSLNYGEERSGNVEPQNVEQELSMIVEGLSNGLRNDMLHHANSNNYNSNLSRQTQPLLNRRL